jgi:hypothetical protein
MKIKLILIILLLAGVALTYTACKKSSNTPTLSTKTVSSQIALNLAQTLYGGLGGFDISDGLSSSASINRKQLALKRQQLALKMSGGKQINDDGDGLLCGLSEDTTLNYSATYDGVSETIKGTLGFTFICTNNTFSGFNIKDNLDVSASNSTLNATYKLNENLTATSQDPTNEDANYTLGGTFSMSDVINYVSPKSTTTESYSYDFTSPLVIDDNGDIDSGAASFTTSGTNASGKWNYSGTITFLGNYNVKIVINGTSYTVNIQTGAVS